MITRSYKSKDARNFEEAPKKAAAAPVLVEKVARPQTPVDYIFQPGDTVSFRSNTRGIVLAVTGSGVQVDFGLGSGWFTQQSLTLIKAASAGK